MVEKKILSNSDILKYHLTELLQTRIELEERNRVVFSWP